MDAAEREAIAADWRRVSAAWKPRDFQGIGCLMLLVAAVLVLAVPKFAAHLPAGVGPAAAGIGVLCGVAGFILMGSRQLQGSPVEIVNAAADALASGSTEKRRENAVTVLFHKYDYRGPTMSSNYDTAAIAQRLGAALPWVESVEQVLVEDLKIHSVFTGPRS